MAILLTTDLHLTDKAADEYRWALFPWLLEQVKEHNVDELLILGDLTDQKDRHSAVLTNRVVSNLKALSCLCTVWILRGNHDCIDPQNPFFDFLTDIPNIKFVTNHGIGALSEGSVYFLPHARDPKNEWKDIKFPIETDYVFMHHTFDGARTSTGIQLEGTRVETYFPKGSREKVYSGDIHVPQKISCVTYVGSPYPVHFGDRYEPRCLLLKDGKETELHFPSIQKLTLELSSPEQLKEFSMKEGDQVKVRLKLSAADVLDWQTHRERLKEISKELGVYLASVELKATQRSGSKKEQKTVLDPQDVFRQFCEKEGLAKPYIDVGKTFIEGVGNGE